MKKLSTLLLATAMSVAAVYAQSLDGSNCGQAIEIPTIPDSCAVNDHQLNAGDHERWHHIKPDQPEVVIRVKPPQAGVEAHVHKLELVKGGCGGLQTIETKNIADGDTLEIARTDMAVNEDYFIKLERDPNCTQCNTQQQAFYGLCVQRNVPCNIIADAGHDTTIFAGQSVQIGSAPVAGLSYSWQPITGLSNANIANPIASPTETTTYVVTVVDGNECNANDMITIKLLNSGDTDTSIYIFSDVYHDSLIHIIWDEIPYFNATRYILEVSYDSINYSVVDSISTDSLIDIMQLSPNQINSFGRINYSTESGPGFIYNQIEHDFVIQQKLMFRIRIAASDENFIFTKKVKAIMPNKRPVIKFLSCPSIETPPSGYVSSGFTYTNTDYELCCSITQTEYSSTLSCTSLNSDFPDICGKQKTYVDCNCACDCKYDKCCEHKCAQIKDCKCNIGWGSCGSGCDILYIVTSVIPLDMQVSASQTVICPGENITLTASGGCIEYEVEWTTSAGVICTYCSPVLTIAPTTTTTYTVHNLYGITASITITVLSSDPVTASATPPNPVCSGHTLNLSSSPEGYSYQWSGPNGFSSTEQNPTIINLPASASGTYSVTVTGCSPSNTASVSVTVLPSPIADAGPDQIIYGNSTFTLGGNPSASGGVSPYSYQWLDNNSNSCSALNDYYVSNPTVTYYGTVPCESNYILMAIGANGCWSVDFVSVSMNPQIECLATYNYTYKSIEFTSNNNATVVYPNGNTVNGNSASLKNNGNYSVSEKIIVSNGNINLWNCNINLGPDAYIEVLTGAKLTLNTCTLTSIEQCPSMWQGIFVKGNPNLNQNPSSNQGMLVLNDCVIRNAHSAVNNYSSCGNSCFNTGGIIQATNTKFENNYIAASFYPYEKILRDNYFKNCIFETNAVMKDVVRYGANSSHDAFVWIWGVDYLWGDVSWAFVFENNIFRATLPTAGIFLKGKGIRSIDAQYTVKKGSGNNKAGNLFQNLDAGIDANRSINSSSVELLIKENLFNNNLRGIILTGFRSTYLIEENTFSQSVLASPFDVNNTIGIYSNGSSRINFFKNSFTKETAGMYINNSASGGFQAWHFTWNWPVNNAWKNTFANCIRGMEFRQDNSHFKATCNSFANNNNVAQAYWVVNNGNVQTPQGAYATKINCIPAANVFDHANAPSVADIFLTSPAGGIDPSFEYIVEDGGNPDEMPTTSYACFDPCSLTTTPCGVGNNCATPTYRVGKTTQQIGQQLSNANSVPERLKLIVEMIAVHAENNQLSQVIPFLESVPDTEAKWLLVPEYIAAKRFTDAETSLNGLQKNNPEKQKRDQYYRVLIDLGKTGRTPKNMSAPEKTVVEQVAVSETEIRHNAQAVLHFWFNEKYEPEFAVLAAPSNKMASSGNQNAVQVKETAAIINIGENLISRIYPNPNNGKMQLDYKLSKGMRGELVIFDLTGRMVKRLILHNEHNILQLDEPELKEGMYLYTILVGGEVIISDKLVIIK